MKKKEWTVQQSITLYLAIEALLYHCLTNSQKKNVFVNQNEIMNSNQTSKPIEACRDGETKELYDIFDELLENLPMSETDADSYDKAVFRLIHIAEQQYLRLRSTPPAAEERPMPLPADPTNPFYIETMEQSKVLKEMATRTGLHQGNQLETIARKLEYMAQAFTCTANFVPIQLKVKKLETELTELRGLAKELDNQLESFDYGEPDNDGSAIRKARYAFQQFLARQNL